MEIITIQCPNCKGNLHLDKDTEKCFCTYCRSEVMVKESITTEGVTLESLVKRGFLSLEYAEWTKAIEVFDQAANIDPEHAMIYVGKLMAELNLRQEFNLGEHHQELVNYINYQKAIRFADNDLKKRLQNYNEQIIEKTRTQKEKEKLAQQQKVERAFAALKSEHEKIDRLKAEKIEANALKQRRIIRNIIIIAVIVILFFIGRAIIQNM